MIELGRRGFITGGAALVASPYVIRVAPLMPVRVWRPPLPPLIIHDGWLVPNGAEANREMFADLFAAIGQHWGSRSSETFTLPIIPDYRLKCAGDLVGMLVWNPT